MAYLERLRTLLRFAKVSSARMGKGAMRADVNLSVRPAGSTELGVRTEMKNMASIAAIWRAIEYETARHIDAIENGTEELVQETRGWDDDAGKSFSMRTKETVGDGKLSNATGKQLLETLFDLVEQGDEIPEDIAAFADAEGLVSSSDTGALEAVVAAVIAADPETAQAYRDGREKALNPLFGACMKELKGKCDTQLLRELLIAELSK